MGSIATAGTDNPEISKSVIAAGIRTNYHDVGEGSPVVFIHGSGPGVSAWANWRMILPKISQQNRAIAPDMVGFGFTDRPENFKYGVEAWVQHLLGFLDALGLDQVDLVGNSFGGALSLAAAIRHPDRFRRLVLMGSGGIKGSILPGLDEVWGYTPSLENMRRMLDIFAYNRDLVTDELAQIRYEASIRPGFQESYSQMFPAPRQRWFDSLACQEDDLRKLPHQTLIVHGREDRVIRVEDAYRMASLIRRAQLHVFGECGHWTQIEQSSRFVQLVGNFLAEAAPSEPIPLS
ncbi:alpha/beta fold hydrolase [Sphingobium sp. 15-1]|uniref:alpha/beta fold hydrolase n=1 Tax=Sphingobium sp. 15-1 TaxID=2729616 RepID=UPI0010F47FB2|nr:alpha/beta hydrolase [Sphingobium sp. 15-1]